MSETACPVRITSPDADIEICHYDGNGNLIAKDIFPASETPVTFTPRGSYWTLVERIPPGAATVRGVRIEPAPEIRE
jgi:hypothetical protein